MNKHIKHSWRERKLSEKKQEKKRESKKELLAYTGFLLVASFICLTGVIVA